MTNVDPRPLAIGRILLGGAALVELIDLTPRLTRLAGTGAFQYPWWEGWSPATNLPWAWIAVWAMAAAALSAGWHTRVAAVVLAAVMSLVITTDQSLYSNHLYLMVMMALLFAWADAGATWSLDARVHDARAYVAGHPVLLLKLQLSAVYLFAALSKLNPSFLSGEVLAGYQRGALVSLPEAWIVPAILGPVAAAAVAAEAFLALGPWTRVLRPVVPVVAVALHVGITLFVAGFVGFVVFGLAMAAIFPLFWARAIDSGPPGGGPLQPV